MIRSAVTSNGRRFKYMKWYEYPQRASGIREITYYSTLQTEIDHLKRESLAELKKLLDATP